MLNVFQLMIALLLDWLMITDAPPWPWMGRRRDHRPASDRPRACCQAERQQRRGREQQIAQAWMHRGVLLEAER